MGGGDHSLGSSKYQPSLGCCYHCCCVYACGDEKTFASGVGFSCVGVVVLHLRMDSDVLTASHEFSISRFWNYQQESHPTFP